MQQDSTLRAKAGNDCRVTQHVFHEQNRKHLNGVPPAKQIVQTHGIGLGITRAGVDTVEYPRHFTHAAISIPAQRRRRLFGRICHKLKARLPLLLDQVLFQAQSYQSRSGA